MSTTSKLTTQQAARSTAHNVGETFVPLDDRAPHTVRTAILARSSDTSAKPEDMQEQVEQCREFIAQMGWQPTPPERVFTEAKSGVRHVARPVLDQVLGLCKRGLIDVVIAREFQRVDRKKVRRYQTIQTALDYGVEFRYANLASTNGKMEDSWESRLIRDIMEEMGEIGRDETVERLSTGKRRRYVEGLPDGGPRRVKYGYAPGERRVGKHGKELGVLHLVVNEQTAEVVRWLYTMAEQTPLHEFSYRELVRALERKGVPTATGKGHWTARQVYNLLHDPIYAGLGRTLRYKVEWPKVKDAASGRVHDTRKVRDRMRQDGEQWLEGTFPIPPELVPPLVSREQFQAVQEKLAQVREQHYRGKPRRTDPAVFNTLLDGPGKLLRCSDCGRQMTRFRRPQKTMMTEYYQCAAPANAPVSGYVKHTIRAAPVDALACKLLAHLLTDPETLLDLAEATAPRAAAAETDAAVAEAAQRVWERRVAEISAQQSELATALAALEKVPGMQRQVADIRAQLAKLATEAEQVEEERAAGVPRQERANERAVFLRRIAAAREGMVDIGTATALLGLKGARERVLAADADIAAGHAPVLEVPLTNLADYLIHHASREQVQKVMREVGAYIVISPPRTRAEWKAVGNTPVAARVALRVTGTGMVLQAAQATAVPKHYGGGMVVGEITVRLDG